ncbi:D-alanine--D-alanine ligase family protein [Peristeroidobacter soli]|jgi:D-alanine-D-alanine ligase|uniref:D-alanine--D-alanine ligase family protein n=1 Tax=Peristeroidobacter soli TaxID=2497877 RepID=UPI00101B75E1|nr:D-alanine--D-alanine ligase [Peristeroidobacter soli]
MKPRRVLVLMHESLVPPASLKGLSDKEIDEFRTEYDVKAALEKAGHEVKALGLGDNLSELRSIITDWKPDVAFNLLEEFQGIVTYDQYVVAFLELMKLPYTGCNPRGMMISRDKALSKQILSYHRIPTPGFAVIRKGQRYRLPRKLKFPLFVKSVTEDASLGISQASVVPDADKLKERIEFIHEQTNSDALIEEYIEGRELYVGVLGNDRLRTLPVWEMDFGTLPDVMAGIATRKVKWDRRYQKKHGIRTGAAQNLPEGCAAYLDKLSKRIFRSLYLSGYARMDFRMRPDGSVFVLEANCNPNISREEDFADSALAAGMEYPALLEQIIRVGNNYQAAWRADEE